MKQRTFGEYAISTLSVTAALGIALGLFLILVDVGFLLNLVFVVLGILTVVNNLPSLVLSAFEWNQREGRVLFLLSLIATVLGVVMIFYHHTILMILLGVYFVLIPLLRLAVVPNRKKLFREELPKLALGVVMILMGPAKLVSVLFRVAGIVVIALTVVYTVSSVITLRRMQHKTGTRVFVDTDGNGKCDTLYIDTTGDGKVDTATRYREDQ